MGASTRPSSSCGSILHLIASLSFSQTGDCVWVWVCVWVSTASTRQPFIFLIVLLASQEPFVAGKKGFLSVLVLACLLLPLPPIYICLLLQWISVCFADGYLSVLRLEGSHFHLMCRHPVSASGQLTPFLLQQHASCWGVQRAWYRVLAFLLFECV